MEKEPSCEQVGFVFRNEQGEYCLSMAGGEFCGNASMSAAALFCWKSVITSAEPRALRLRVSGAPAPVAVHVTAKRDGSFACSVRMPEPERITEAVLPLNGKSLSFPLVCFPGISHIIIARGELNADEAERVIRDWCGRLSVPGLGIMLFEKTSMFLRPLVYVPGPDTLFWESSCASGTAALGAFLARKEGGVSLSINEPGGVLRVESTPEGAVALSGYVTILEKRQIVVNL